MVEASASNGERRVVVQVIAIKQDGTRVPTVERQYEKYYQGIPAKPRLTNERRHYLFRDRVEPILQRELKHKGTTNNDDSYSADLIGYVEIVPQN